MSPGTTERSCSSRSSRACRGSNPAEPRPHGSLHPAAWLLLNLNHCDSLGQTLIPCLCFMHCPDLINSNYLRELDKSITLCIHTEAIALKGDFPGGRDKSPRTKGRVTTLSRFVSQNAPWDGLSHPVPIPKPQPTKQPRCKLKATHCFGPDMSGMGDAGTIQHLWMVSTSPKWIRREAGPGGKDTGSNPARAGGHSSAAGGDWSLHRTFQSLPHLVATLLLSPSFLSLFLLRGQEGRCRMAKPDFGDQHIPH